MAMRFEVDPDKTFSRAVQKAAEEVGDLRIPLTLIAKQWFQSNKAIFSLSGPGKYKDLSKLYKRAKLNRYGHIYPIFGTRKGPLEKSITDPNDGGAVNNIINKTTLVMGTRVPHAIFHQGPGTRTKMPFRPIVMIGSEQIAPPELNKRRDIWIKMLGDYVKTVTNRNIGSGGGVLG